MPPAVALKKPSDPPAIRRFGLADLTQHGGWMLARLQKALPHLRGEREAAAWLAGKINSNEHLFLYGDDAAAMAQVVHDEVLDGSPVVRERFVWCREPVRGIEALIFYDEFARWARSMGAKILVLEVDTDVPHDAIRDKFGRVFARQLQFARL